MSEMILEITDGTDIELTLPIPFDMTLDQGRGPQGPAGPAAGDASVSTLTDVELESLTDLDFLSYDGSSSKWKNGPLTDLISISSEDIEDSTEIGRNVLTAVDAPSAREELGAGTSNFDGNYNSLTGKPDLGTASSSEVSDFDAAGSAAAAQTAAEAYADGIAGAITSDDITDASTVGKAVLTATDAATARTAIGAGTSSLALGTSSTTALAGDTAIPSTPADIGAATAAQGALADSAVQTADLDTAIASEVSRADAAYATATQGGEADTAVQPGDPGLVPWFNVTNYSATGDGSTDDTSAINDAIAALNTAGAGILYLPAGTYVTTGGLTAIDCPATVLGDGCADSHFRAAGTTVTCSSATAVLFTVGTSGHGTKFADLNLANTAGSAPTAGAAIQVLGGDGARYERLTIAGFWINIDHQDGQEWSMDACFLYSPVKYALKLQHVDLTDGGDMGITNSQFLCGDYDADAAIRWESGGGLRLTNCKINTRTLSHFFAVGLDATFTGFTTVDLNVAACSFENVTGPYIKGRLGASGVFYQATIAGNQFAYYSSTSASAVDIDGWGDITAVGNTFAAKFSGSSAAAIKLANVTGGAVGLNTVDGFSGGELSQTSCSGIKVIPATAADVSAVPTTRTITAGTGLSGGGALSADRTLSVDTTAEAERIRDVIGSALVAGTNVTITVDDAGDTITITASGGSSGVGTDTIWNVKGDLAIGTGSDTASRLGVGTDTWVLTADSSQTTGVKWAAPSSGFSDPLTTKGDLIVHGSSTTRLGVGSDGQVLTADAASTNGVKWATASGGSTAAVPYFAKTSGAGDINLGVVSSYADITGLSLSVAAAVDDKIMVTVSVATYNENGADQDIGIAVAGTNKVAGGAASQGVNKPAPVCVQWLHTVVSGDISGGNVAIKAQVKAPSGNTWIYNNATHGITGQISAVNYAH